MSDFPLESSLGPERQISVRLLRERILPLLAQQHHDARATGDESLARECWSQMVTLSRIVNGVKGGKDTPMDKREALLASAQIVGAATLLAIGGGMIGGCVGALIAAIAGYPLLLSITPE